MENSDDILLLKLIKQNDELAFKHLFYQYVDSLVRFVMCYVHDRSVAEEIVSDIFIYIWEHRATFSLKLTFKAYLFQSAKNKSFTYLRDRQLQPVLSGIYPSDLGYEDTNFVEMEELSQLIEEAVTLLPEKCREIFLKSRVENQTNKDIAAGLGISEKTVENQITIALKKIRAFLGDSYFYLW